MPLMPRFHCNGLWCSLKHALSWSTYRQERKLHDNTVLSSEEMRRLANTIVDATGFGPFDGGCLALAHALQLRLGGEIVTLSGNLGAEHAVLMVNGVLVDFNGPTTPQRMLRRFNGYLAASHDDINCRYVNEVCQLLPDDFPYAPVSPEIVARINQALPLQFKERAQVAINAINNPQVKAAAPTTLLAAIDQASVQLKEKFQDLVWGRRAKTRGDASPRPEAPRRR